MKKSGINRAYLDVVNQLLIRTSVFSRNQGNNGRLWYNNSDTSLQTPRMPITQDVVVEQHPNQNWNTQQKPSKNQHEAGRKHSSACCLLHDGFLLVLLFDPDDGGDMFPPNVD
jgi:hypothetical protein